MPDRKYFNDRRKERRKVLYNLLGGKCVDCGTTRNLQFDHLDPSKKSFRISSKIDAPDDNLIAEVKKCQLLCGKCHAKKTRENWEYGHEESKHGTLWRYKSYGCRCDLCKTKMSDYNRKKKLLRLLGAAKRKKNANLQL